MWSLEDEPPFESFGYIKVVYPITVFVPPKVSSTTVRRAHVNIVGNTNPLQIVSAHLQVTKDGTLPNPYEVVPDFHEIPPSTREASWDPHKVLKDPFEASRDPLEVSRDPHEVSKDPLEVSWDLHEVSKDPLEASAPEPLRPILRDSYSDASESEQPRSTPASPNSQPCLTPTSPNPQNQVVANETAIEIELVISPKKRRKLRELNIEVPFFDASGFEPLNTPPDLQPYGMVAEPHDLFVYRWIGSKTRIIKVWRCESKDPVVWSRLHEGREYPVLGQTMPRYFVLTEGGLPSYVSRETMTRGYKRLLVP